jgi:predicted DNA-binding transcriptional regulator AlpA
MQTRLLRLPEVSAKTGLPRSTIYRKVAQGNFPRIRKLGERTSAFVESEIDEWILARVDCADRCAAPPPRRSKAGGAP